LECAGLFTLLAPTFERSFAKTTLEFEFEVDRATLPEVARLLIAADRSD
jgi:hypothetical protein